MARRSRAREVALQLLYQHDHNPVDFENSRRFLQDRLRNSELVAFADSLFGGVQTHRSEIDKHLAGIAENWSVERMATVDRNILRLGTFELLFQPDTPMKVAIDEAVELAKRYGAVESPAFVNGILDKVASARPATAADPEITAET